MGLENVDCLLWASESCVLEKATHIRARKPSSQIVRVWSTPPFIFLNIQWIDGLYSEEKEFFYAKNIIWDGECLYLYLSLCICEVNKNVVRGVQQSQTFNYNVAPALSCVL